MRDLFIAGLEMMGINYKKDDLEKLLAFYNELSIWNRKAGFIKAEGVDLVKRHFFDSLAPLTLLESLEFRTIADIGTGAGFPGIPLSIFLPDKSFTLVERSSKRASFLYNCKMLFALDNVVIEEKEVENINPGFDCLVFRAFRDFNEYAATLAGLLTDNGFMFAYKGRKDEVVSEMKNAGIERYRIEKISVPFMTEERHIVITEKKDISLR